MDMLTASLVALWVAVRIVQALTLPVSDCDETFNFIEPQHYLLYGYGMQTWEYSQQFALRSYAFLWLYTAPAAIAQRLWAWWPQLSTAAVPLATALIGDAAGRTGALDEGLFVYFAARCCTAVVAVGCEWFLVASLPLLFQSTRSSLVRGASLKRLAVVVLLGATVVGHAAFSTLPTSFCMSLYFIATGCWLRAARHQHRPWQRRYVWGAVFSVVAIGVLGWPFALFLALPMALHFVVCAFSTSVVASLAALVCCCIVLVVDGRYYHCPSSSVIGIGSNLDGATVSVSSSSSAAQLFACAAWNIVRYNVFGQEGRGAELYGVEAWDYFVRNLLVNFNVLFLVAATLPLVAVKSALSLLARRTDTKTQSKQQQQAAEWLRLCLYASPFYLWFALWTSVPHKEERFMVPAYPFFLVGVVGCLYLWWDPCATHNDERRQRDHRGAAVGAAACKRALVVLLVGCFLLVSVGRYHAIRRYYGGAQEMWIEASLQPLLPKRGGTVCVGSEWFRFPSHFFLAHASTVQEAHQPLTYRFLNTTSFQGALPKPFGPLGSCDARPDMNDLNRPNDGQFVEDVAASCDFVWDAMDAEAMMVQRAPFHGERPVMAASQQWVADHGWDPAVFDRNVLVSPEGTYRLLDAGSTPMWCRVLHFPVWPLDVVYQRCARWKTLVLRSRSPIHEGV